MNEAQVTHALGRSIGAVVTGVIAIVVLSTATDAILHATGVFAPMGQPMATGLWLLASAYRFAYGVAGGWLTSRLAPGRPMRHAVILGVIGIAASLAGLIATWKMGPEFGPKWYPIGLVVTALPSCWLGGALAGGRAGRG